MATFNPNAFEIARILLLSNFISLDDFISTIHNIVNGKMRFTMAKAKAKKGKVKKK